MVACAVCCCSVSLLQVVVDMCIVVCKDICACNGHHRIYTVVAGGVYIACVYMCMYIYIYIYIYVYS